MLSYDLLSELPLKHKSHNNSLPELLFIITLTNTSSIIRTEQTKHIKDDVITVAKVFRKASKATTLETITVSRKAETAADITY